MKKLLQIVSLIFLGLILISMLYEVKTAPVCRLQTNEVFVTGNYKILNTLNLQGVYRMNTYLPRFRENTRDVAEYYCNSFDISGNFEEDEEFFSISDNQSRLIVYKFLDYIRYESKLPPATGYTSITSEEAVKKALAFIEARCLSLKFDHSNTEFNDNTIKVIFVDKLGNYEKNDFNTCVTMDCNGRILSMDYYCLKYNIYNNCEIKSMIQAAEELPETNEEVTVNSVTLNYVYENSILQPAYIFKGVTEDGSEYSEYVKAAIYR